MIAIYAEKASLAKAIAVALKAGNRIANKKEPTIGHYEFTFNGEKLYCVTVSGIYAVWLTEQPTESSIRIGI